MNSSLHLNNQTVVTKPWGSELIWAHTDNYVGKIINVNATHELSIQFHKQKEETLYVLNGIGVLNIFTMDEDGDVLCAKSLELTQGMSFHLEPNIIHNIRAITDLSVIEVSTNYLNDVVRLYDKYGRV